MTVETTTARPPAYDDTANTPATAIAAVSCTPVLAVRADGAEIRIGAPSCWARASTATTPSTMPRVSISTSNTRAPAVT